MTPTDQTSTLEEILGGFLPTTKHSGGKYLQEEKPSVWKTSHRLSHSKNWTQAVLVHDLKTTIT